jgi:hypothetical protein
VSILAGVLSIIVHAAPASAHVAFLAPPAVENENDPNAPKTPPKLLKFGTKYKLVWEVQILHDPEDFDIDLLETKDGTPTAIVHGLPPETLEYEWTVPETPCTACLLRVTQNNTINDDYTGFAPVTLSESGGGASEPEPGGAGLGGSDTDPGGGGTASGGSASSGGTASGGSASSGGKASSASGSTSSPVEPKTEKDGGCSSSGRPAPLSGIALTLLASAAWVRARRRSRLGDRLR